MSYTIIFLLLCLFRIIVYHIEYFTSQYICLMNKKETKNSFPAQLFTLILIIEKR